MNEQKDDPAKQRQRAPGAQGLYDPAQEHDACGIGFVVDIKGRPSHDIVNQALTVLENLRHRGAAGSEPNTGDGAGIMIQLPDAFLRRVAAESGFNLPGQGAYGVGAVMLPADPTAAAACETAVSRIVAEEGQRLLGWRTVPTDNSGLGETAVASEPRQRHLFIGRRGRSGRDPLAFERKLYVIRRRAEREIRHAAGHADFYIASLSTRTLVFKGMLLAEQLRAYFPDLSAPDLASALGLVHSRFSTNTFPSWARAHPNRYIIHNGEINTLRGNVNWLRAREARFTSALFGDDLPKLLPVADLDGSDSAIFDNCLELLVLAGRSLPHAVMMMIPEPWAKHELMDPARRAFYQYHSCLMEPWDGPASIGFTDGIRIGAVLDRNGLRPSRYYVTADDRVILASEVGVLDVPADQIVRKGRLQPGRMFLVDTAAGRIVDDAEIKGEMAAAAPYRAWLDANLQHLAERPGPGRNGRGPKVAAGALRPLQHAFGYTYEDLRLLLAPMAANGIEPLGSMGDDTPLAVLSDRPQSLFNYFKQLFAQVTNPPIDAIREELITATETYLGAEGDLLNPGPDNCRRLLLPHPLLTDDDLARLRAGGPPFRAATLPTLFPPDGGADGLAAALAELCAAADAAIDDGAALLILSDTAVDRHHAPIPALLAVSAVHHHLIRHGRRTLASLIVESGEPREVHHFATLLGYGADAINPYLALASLVDIIERQLVIDLTPATAAKHYLKALVKGVVKTCSKMGISTLQSYRGAQIFEALGLDHAVVARYFTGTPSRLGGIGLDVLAEEVCRRHVHAFPERPYNGHTLDAGGQYQWREGGEYHLFNPATVHALQRAVRSGDEAAYQQYATAVDDHNRRFCTLRGLLELQPAPQPIPLDEVEPIEAILSRFKTGAMSYGSLSQEAHETLAIAMNRIGGKSNTGEGGEDPSRYRYDQGGDSKLSAIKQVASGRFGVTSEYLVNATEIQIKMAQGAKPGEGGQLPGHKVYPWIAKVRHATPGVGLISPPPHHDIYSIEDLAQLIYDLKNANPRARINVKLVSEVGVGTIAAGVAKGHADVILISGHDGGTGASPKSSIRHAGLPWELGLAETHQTLLLNDLRSRVVLETDGQLKTGRDVVVAALLGAEEYGFATAPLVAMGCIMMRVCQLNTCPVGVATQDPELRARFAGKPEDVVNFMRFIAADVRRWMARLGFRTIDEMIGRSDRLNARAAVDHWKARGLDLSPILYRPQVPAHVGRYAQIPQEHGLDRSLDRRKLLALCRPALEAGRPVVAALPIRNIDRTVGTILGSEVTRRYGGAGLPDDTIQLHFTGSAGQSFGAFVPRGITLNLTGDANDYVGKGLSGGKLVVRPPRESTFAPEENVLIGNVALYGATGGEAYFYGLAGERFAVRNSGVDAVVEAVGDHGCEYMTGGRVVVLGATGRNFAAGMSGGVAYVFDDEGDFAVRCNQEMVALHRLADPDEIEAVRDLVWRHATHTGSRRAWQLLRRWDVNWPFFVKVLPRDYERMLTAIAHARAEGLDGDEALLAAFEANKRDVARISGS